MRDDETDEIDDGDLGRSARNQDKSKHHFTEWGVLSDEEVIGLAPLIPAPVLIDALPKGSLGKNVRIGAGYNRGIGVWLRPDGSEMPAAEIRQHVERFVEARCGFTPRRALVNYLIIHVLRPYYAKDELVAWCMDTLEHEPDGLVCVTELWECWKALPLKTNAVRTRSVKPYRTFKASEAEFRQMFEDRGYIMDEAREILVGYRFKVTP